MTRFLPIQFAVLSDVGEVRFNNEDSYLVYLPPLQEAEKLGVKAVLIVADGMGGHALGELASQTAVKAFTERFFEALARQPAKMEQALHNALDHANNAVYQLAQEGAKGRPGTTLTALVLRDDSFYIAHVGDSRAYLFRDGQLRQLTTDHTWVAQEIAHGRMKPYEAQSSPFRNYLTRALGSQPTVEADILAGGLKEGDLFLLCSDGLTSNVRDDELAILLRNSVNLQETCERMVTMANERGGHDNITVILAQVGLKQTTKPFAPIRQAQIPTQPHTQSQIIRKRKRIQWKHFIFLIPLPLAIGLSLGLLASYIVRVWKIENLSSQPTQKILRPQRSTVTQTKPPSLTIPLQVQLLADGLQFVAREGKLDARKGKLNPEKREKEILVRFKYPEKSYSALKSGQAKIVLKKGKEKHECSFQIQSICEISLQVGEWEVRYIAEPETDLLLCILRLEAKQR